MYTHVRKLIQFCSIALLTTPLYAQQAPDPHALPGFGYYATHAGVQVATVVGMNILAQTIIDSAPKKFGKPDLSDVQQLALISTFVAGAYACYKTPEWTDTYILKNNNTYTTGQNLIRIFGPVGNYIVQLQNRVSYLETVQKNSAEQWAALKAQHAKK